MKLVRLRLMSGWGRTGTQGFGSLAASCFGQCFGLVLAMEAMRQGQAVAHCLSPGNSRSLDWRERVKEELHPKFSVQEPKGKLMLEKRNVLTVDGWTPESDVLREDQSCGEV